MKNLDEKHCHTRSEIAYPLWGCYYGEEPEIGEHFKVPTVVTPSGLAAVLKYHWQVPPLCHDDCADGEFCKITSRVKRPIRFRSFWSIYMEPVLDDPCDSDFMEEIST